MNQEEASKIALLTIADYLCDPHAYDPDAAWEAALARVPLAEYARDHTELRQALERFGP